MKTIKKYLLIAVNILFCTIIFAQNNIGGKPLSFTQSLTSIVPVYAFPAQTIPNDTTLTVIDTLYDSFTNTVEIDTFSEDGRELVGIGIDTSLYIYNRSNISTVTSGKIYRFKVSTSGAKEIGLIISGFYIPNGATFYVYTPDSSIIRGGYTSLNNNNDSIFVVAPIPTNSLCLEFFIPNSYTIAQDMRVSQLIYNYSNTDTSSLSKISDIDESCYGNVHCRTNYYGGIERSVIKFYFQEKNSWYICSCALINQNVVSNNLKNYVLTARHCGNKAKLATAIFYFNNQYPTCPSSNEYSKTLFGATYKTDRIASDMYLMELKESIPPEYNVFYAGWDHRKYPSGTGSWMLGIHHPRGVTKKYSEGTLQKNLVVDKWRIKWNRNNKQFTDNGSSGSPLFEDINGRIIGQLSTGPVGKKHCGKLKSSDIWRYGKIYRSWANLEPYLDPTYSQTQLNGRIPCYDNLTMQTRTFPNALDYQPNSLVKIQCGTDMTFTPTIYGSLYLENTFNYGANYLFTAGNSITIDVGGIDIPLGTTVEFNIGACTAY